MTETLQTKVGAIELGLTGDALCAVRFVESAADDARSDAAARLRAYFDGDLDALHGARLALRGTPFQRAVWEAVAAIPPGRTRSYGELARALGRASASRAVGAANGQNRLALFIPCHRVIGASGALTGYAWGLARKEWLLAHEERNSTREAMRCSVMSAR